MLFRGLVAVDPPGLSRRLQVILRQAGIDPTEMPARGDLWKRLTHEDYDLVVLGGAVVPDPPEGFIASILRLPEHPGIIVMRAKEDAAERARLLAAGCLAVLWQGLPDPALSDAVQTIVARQHNEAVSRLRADRPEERYSLNDFIYASPAMQEFMLLARKVVASDSTLLILGETGVGKERLARAIHAESRRANGPFMAINCGALPEHLLESELFGHEEGAFTGATRSRKGYFELAHRGTIFLDEIAEMPVHLQVKLLRVLENHRLHRVGGERPIKVDVRVMAATNRDPESEVKAKRFRLDLYYRLAVVTLHIPPLRDRRDDIPLLARSYLDHFRTLLGRRVTDITLEAMQALAVYGWPGNVRELINVIERAVLLCQGTAIDIEDLPGGIGGGQAATGTPLDGMASAVGADALRRLTTKPLAEARRTMLDQVDRMYVAAALEATRGRVGEAARRAGINARSLYALMKRHGLKKEAFKAGG